MRILVLDGQPRCLSEPLIADVASHLGRYGIRLDRTRASRPPRRRYEAYAALIATSDYPFELRKRIPCYGESRSNMPSRAETLEWLRQAGLPTMRWSLARDPRELDELFERWDTDAVLLKPSDSCGGTSVSLFARHRAPEIAWNPEKDVFCPEVNPDDGDVYKLEMLGPTVLLGWKSHSPPSRSRMVDGGVQGLFGLYGVRELFDWPDEILAAARRFGEVALDRGYAHISLDFMRNREGGFEAIEVNLGNVALWWTTQFRSFRRRYARGVERMLAERHGAPATPAPVAVRLRSAARGTLIKPKLIVREIQAARLRGRHAGELASRNAAGLQAATGAKRPRDEM
jgi:hypothetical protein